ncbi:MAG: PLP-dependent aminotransferase family protein [Bryobacteraceae bacterium]
MRPELRLDSHSGVPLYRQLFERLKGSIDSGELASGARLPATRELAGLLGLNRTTVSAAYELLESAGLISGHVGRGSFVTGPAPRAALDWNQLLPPAEASLPAPAAARISFASSRPAEDLFPLSEFRATCDEVLQSPEGRRILQLGSPGGYGPLLQFLRKAEQLRPADDLIVTSGCQQALDLLARVLLAPGDKVAIEDPVYPGAKNIFARARARMIGVPVGPDGIRAGELEHIFSRERPKLLVVTSSFQNPTGATMPLEARRAILRLARAAGVFVLENDTYGELRYEGEDIATLKELDDTGHTVRLRSFSKIAFPGLRVGWASGPQPLIARMIEAKHLADLHTDQLSQAVLLRFAESGRLDAHRRRVLKSGAVRLHTVLTACRRHLPAGSEFTRPQGGMNLWVRLPEPLDAAELLPRVQREGVTYLPGKYFAVGRWQPGALRLSFAGLDPGKIREGLAAMGEVFSAELARLRLVRGGEPVPAMV